MMRTKTWGALAVVVMLAAALVVAPASAGKKKRMKVPETPEIPTSFLPESLQVPPAAEAAVSQWWTPAESLTVVAVFLQLTPEQVDSLTSLLRQRHDVIVPLVQEINERQRQILEQLQSGAPDPLAIGTLVIEIHQYLQEVREAQATFMGGFLGLLNDEQRRRYEAIRLAERLQPFLPAFRTLRLL